MIRWILTAVLAVLPFTAVVSQEVAAPEVPPTFPAQVEQVTVDVVVVDRQGQPVTDLKKEDLEVYEDNVPQTIASFDAFQAPPLTTEAPAPRSPVSTNAEARGERRG